MGAAPGFGAVAGEVVVMTGLTIPRSYREKWERERARPDVPATLGEFLAVDDPAGRWPVVRDRSERVMLPKWLRIAVLKRDGFACRICQRQGGRLEVDHIIPWSAGGPDASWNLRTLCYDCNQGRSNFHGWDSWALPIVLWCVECEGRRRGVNPDDDAGWAEWAAEHHGTDEVRCRVWCDRCHWFSGATLDAIDASAANAVERPS